VARRRDHAGQVLAVQHARRYLPHRPRSGSGKIRWRIEHDYRELKTGLGLDHFEGRSWLGWHRDVTLVTAAHLFITTLRLDPKAAAPV
jgi:SRSO17 transposase